MNKCVVLMPFSQYKKKDLYKYVESLELADPKLFEDASISNNLCITICRNKPVDKYSWKDLLLESVDQRYRVFYKWNIEHNKGLVSMRKDFQAPEMFNRDLDFIDTSRCIGREHGYGYHAKNTSAYKWNNFISGYENGWLASILTIRFPNKASKDNYCKYAYNWTIDKYACLESKVMGELNTQAGSSTFFFWIPQIDWENISNSSLWKAGNYDEAVLSEMGLKFDENGVIVKC